MATTTRSCRSAARLSAQRSWSRTRPSRSTRAHRTASRIRTRTNSTQICSHSSGPEVASPVPPDSWRRNQGPYRLAKVAGRRSPASARAGRRGRAVEAAREKAMATRETAMGTAELLTKQYFTKDQARAIATELGIDFRVLGCDLEQFRLGLGVELEHGPRNPESDVSGDHPLVTGRIALAHLTEFPDYYTRLAVLEREAADHKSRKK